MSYADEWDRIDRGEPRSRVPIYQAGRLVGTMPPDFNGAARSTSFMYDPRPNDFKPRDDGFDADPKLGPGDLTAIPGFRPSEPE